MTFSPMNEINIKMKIFRLHQVDLFFVSKNKPWKIVNLFDLFFLTRSVKVNGSNLMGNALWNSGEFASDWVAKTRLNYGRYWPAMSNPFRKRFKVSSRNWSCKTESRKEVNTNWLKSNKDEKHKKYLIWEENML